MGVYDKINAALTGKPVDNSSVGTTKIGKSTADFPKRPTRQALPSMDDHADDLHPVQNSKPKMGAVWDQ